METHYLSESSHLDYYLTLTETVEGEILLFEKYTEGSEEGTKWAELVATGLNAPENTVEHILSQRDLVKKVLHIPHHVMVPQINNFTPPQRTPWGGDEIVKHYKLQHGVDTSDIVGECWEISGHRSFPNTFELRYGGTLLNVPISLLELWDPVALYGEKNHRQMPFLVKLLNSGSWKNLLQDLALLFQSYKGTSIANQCSAELNLSELEEILLHNYHQIHNHLCDLSTILADISTDESDEFLQKLQAVHQKMIEKNLSIQVHPNHGDYGDKPSKTEAWTILGAEQGAGLYLGLKEGVTKEEFEKDMREGGDLSNLLNFVEAKPGDVFLIPTGTLHAIGAGMLLIEPQETSESTFRAYDWGRLSNGKPRQLHYDETINVTNWNAPRGLQCIETLQQKSVYAEQSGFGAIITPLVSVKEFCFDKISFPSTGDSYVCDQSRFEAYFVAEGAVEIENNDVQGESITLKKGQSFLLPSALGKCTISTETPYTEIFQTYINTSK